jgi:hypothetical protein
MVDELRPAAVLRRVHAALLEPAPQLVLVARPEPLQLERVQELEPSPRSLQVDLVPAER